MLLFIFWYTHKCAYIDEKTEGGGTGGGVVYNAVISYVLDSEETPVITVESVKKGEDDVDWGTITDDLGTAYGNFDLTVCAHIANTDEDIDEDITLRLAGVDNNSDTIWFSNGYILGGYYNVFSLEGAKGDETDEITWDLKLLMLGNGE